MASTKRRPRGFGSAYKRGQVWWIRYQHKGEQVREPGGLDGSGARTKEGAEEKLKQRMAEMAAERYTGPEAGRYKVGEMLDDYVAALKAKGAKSIKQTHSHIANIREVFDRDRALNVTTKHLREFTAVQFAAEYAPATVNRGLQVFRAAFTLAHKEDRLPRVPYFPMLREDNARKGFFEEAEHEAIKAKLPEPHASIAEFGYRSGRRLGEILPLRDEDGELTEVGQVVEDRWAARVFDTKDGPAISR